MLSLLRRWNTRVRQGAARRPARTRLGLESLEDRCVPAVVFKPNFGAESLVGSNDGMQNPNVYLIFSGSYWTNTAQGRQDEATMTQAAQSILGGPYLSGLTQYGASGTATFAGSWNDPSDVPVGNPAAGLPTGQTLRSYLQTSVTDDGALPGANDPQHAPIYVVVSDPASSGAQGNYNGAFNLPGTFTQWTYHRLPGRLGGYVTPVNENIHMIWLGTSAFHGPLDTDIATHALSHELAERISDPDANGDLVVPAAGTPSSITGGYGRGQVADFEPEAYGYRLNGVWVQPYWSAADGAFIVPDGNVQNFDLTPAWDPGYTVHVNGQTFTQPPTFTGHYNLFLQGDQLGPDYGDNIRIDSAAYYADGVNPVQVTMNGETATFERGAIQNIRVDTVGGDNVVQAASLASRVSLNIDSTGYQSNDVVVVGDDNDSLANIHGPVSVSNTSGRTTLVVDGGGDGPGYVEVGDSWVEFNNSNVGLVEISYTGGTSSGTGVTGLQVIDGVGTNNVYVASTPAYTGVTVFGDSQDFIWGPGADAVQFWATHW